MATEPASLEQLQDIILPPAIGNLPAPAWIVLIVLLVAIVAAVLIVLARYHHFSKARKEALAQLNSQLSQTSNAVITANELLKRAALAYFDRHQVASLNGAAWWKFLDSQLPESKRAFEQHHHAWESALYGADTAHDESFVELSHLWLRLGLRSACLRKACWMSPKATPKVLTEPRP